MSYGYNGKHIRWNKKQRLACEKAKFKCQICGSEDKINVHHLDRNISNNDISNLKVLCLNCHLKEHGRTPGGKHHRIHLLFDDNNLDLYECIRQMAFDKHTSISAFIKVATEKYIKDISK